MRIGSRAGRGSIPRSTRFSLVHQGVLLLSLCASACGGGGGGSAPAVSFSFQSAGTSVAEDDAPTAVQVVLHTSLPALTLDATVDVADAVSGTATPGVDYSPFAIQTLTFPAGSIEGDSRTVDRKSTRLN